MADDKPQDKPPTSRLGRLARLATLAPKSLPFALEGAKRALGVKRTEEEQEEARKKLAQDAKKAAEAMLKTLGEMKGLPLKLGQMASYIDGIVPPGYEDKVQRALKKLQDKAPPLSPEAAETMVKSELGAPPEHVFGKWEREPFAAASIGQVHRAWTKHGDHVAVKVQYPGIAATIASDMQLARAALRALAHTDLPLPTDPVMDSVMDEIEATLLREVDYLQEAEQLQWFAEHAALPGVAMARPLLSHTRAQVLTQQYLPGLHLDAWLATQPQQALRDRAGQHLWDWFMHCIFGLGRVHADPHPGNFLFAADGTVGVLDFGCTRELSEGFRTQMARAWSALLRPAADPQRDALVLQAYQALGLAGPDLALATYSAELAPALADMQAWQLEPFTQAVFDFSTKQPPPITPPEHQRVLGRHLAQVPGEMPAFDRMWMGLMHLLTRLGARVHTRAAGIPVPPTERTFP